MTLSDYEKTISLWKKTPGIGLSTADKRINVESFLNRNSDTSFVALNGNEIIGTVLCGSDGRRGYMYHLVVKETWRKREIGKMLVKKCLTALQHRGIEKCHLFVYATNKDAMKFYEKLGWQERVELKIFSSPTAASRKE